MEDSGDRLLASTTAWNNVRIGLNELHFSSTQALNFRKKLKKSPLLSLSATVRKHQNIATENIVDYVKGLREEYHLQDEENRLGMIADGDTSHVVIEQFDKDNVEDGYQLFAAGIASDRKYCSAVLLTWNIGSLTEILQLSLSRSASGVHTSAAHSVEEECCVCIGLQKVADFICACLKIWFYGLSNESPAPRRMESEGESEGAGLIVPTLTTSSTEDLLNFFRQQALEALELEGIL